MIYLLFILIGLVVGIHSLVMKAVSGYSEYGMAKKDEWTRFEASKSPRTFLY